MDQQNTASFRVNSGSQTFGQYRQELYVEYSSTDVDNKDTDMGKSGWVNPKGVILQC